MKYLKVLVSLAFVMALGACGGGNKTTTDTSGSGSGTALFTSAPATLSMERGASATSFSIGGGTAPFAISTSNAAVAAVTVTTTGKTGSFTVSAGAAGTAQVLITDSAGAKVTLDVTVTVPVPPALTVSAPSAIEVPSGLGVPATYRISGGVTPYSAFSSNNGVAVVGVVSGTTLIVYGDKAGTATVEVQDAAGTRVAIAVTVSSSASVPAVLTVLPAGASGMIGDVLTFTIGGGTAAYTATAVNASIASLSAITTTSTGGTFTATLRNTGSTDIILTDSKGQTLTFTVTVTAQATQIRLSPDKFIVGENEMSAISLYVYGGTPPYRALTSDTQLSLVNIYDGNRFQVSTGMIGSRCINPVDDAGVYIISGTYDVTLTVIDALGATATSTMTIKDNGAGLGAGCP